MTSWDDYRFFQAVKKAGTLKGAAITLGTDQATVGRRLYALEAELGTKLFEKRSNGYFLTAAGERVSQNVDRIEDEFDTVSRRIAGDEERLEGTIRIAAPGGVANHFLIPRLRNFLDKHPGITLQFLTSSDLVSLSKREADIAIRFVRPEQQNLQVSKIGIITMGAYASKLFLKERNHPRNLEALVRLPFVGLTEESMSDLEESLLMPIRSKLKYAVIAQTWTSVYQGVHAGLGWGIVPEFMAKIDQSLERILVLDSSSTPLWLVVHPDLKKNARVKALRDELKKIF